MIKYKNILFELLVVCLLLATAFGCIRFFDLDLWLSKELYLGTSFNEDMLEAIAFFGKYISVLIAGIFVIKLPFLYKRKHPLRKEILMSVLLLGIGPGFMNNMIFKPFFNRPRPKEINIFNKNRSEKICACFTTQPPRQVSFIPQRSHWCSLLPHVPMVFSCRYVVNMASNYFSRGFFSEPLSASSAYPRENIFSVTPLAPLLWFI